MVANCVPSTVPGILLTQTHLIIPEIETKCVLLVLVLQFRNPRLRKLKLAQDQTDSVVELGFELGSV